MGTYYEKYQKYKAKYSDLKRYKYIDLVNKFSEGSIDYYMNDKIIIPKSKTDKMAQILKWIMKRNGISKTEYFIIAGYGLRDYREVTDIDVAVSKQAYNKLRQGGQLKVGMAKISKTERLYLELPEIDSDAEIEIFELENKGFPSNKFSLRNMQKHDYLIEDLYGNPYMKPKAVAMFYNVKLVNGKLMNSDYEISKERLEKNIRHLKLLQDNIPSLDIGKQIRKMEEILTFV